MRIAIIGLGNQGRKRAAIAGAEVVLSVDPVAADATHRALDVVDFASFDAAIVSTPDEVKTALVQRLIAHGKHVLVEKPLLLPSLDDFDALAAEARARGVQCITAYNHRFEPHFAEMRSIITSGRLGRLYLCRLFYGNGTARDVFLSAWRDQGAGVLPDLGSHLIDTALFWFGEIGGDLRLSLAERFENRAPDHVAFIARGKVVIEMEMSLLSWRNHFTCDLYGERGSAHIDSLCKWGPATLTLRDRVLPSGRPSERVSTLLQPDPTWALEYADFKDRIARRAPCDLNRDQIIQRHLTALSQAIVDVGGTS